MDDHARLARAEAEFREAVQREQSSLMASGVTRSEVSKKYTKFNVFSLLSEGYK